jgi:hypothetical protein
MGGRWVTGYWSAGSNRIVLAGEAQLNGAAVRHEMLHALVRHDAHARDLFLARCGGIVECGAACIADAGPARMPDPATVSVTPESLDVEVRVETFRGYSASADAGGFITMTVTVRNPAAHPVVVQLPAIAFPAFFYEIRGSSPQPPAGLGPIDDGVAIFAAGEAKRQVFDFRITAAATSVADEVAPGEYVFRGGYGRRYRDVTVVVTPD